MRSKQNDNYSNRYYEAKEGKDEEYVKKNGGTSGRVKRDRRRNVVIFGIFIAVSSAIYVVEGVVPFPVPGGKWGFSNFLVLYFSYFGTLSDALILALSKSLLGSMLSGSLFTPGFFMGFFGSLAAATVQSIISKVKLLSIFGVSIVGMVVNNIVQFFVGSILIGSSAIYSLLPIVLFLGTISAIANAYLARRTVDIVKENVR